MNQPTHPVSSLSLPDQTAINSFIKQTKLAYGSDLHTVILYGSKARGDANVESDIDLLIVMNRDNWQLRHALSDIASHVSLAHDVTISVQLVSLQRWQQMKQEAFLFFRNIFREGVPLFDPGDLFQDMPVHENLLAE